MIQGHQHPRLAHPSDELIGRDDDVKTGIACLELGEQFIGGRKEVYGHLNTGILFELR